MIVKLKYVGTTGGGLTQNNIYTVISMGPAHHAVILDDNDDFSFVADYAEGELWELESIETLTSVKIYEA